MKAAKRSAPPAVPSLVEPLPLSPRKLSPRNFNQKRYLEAIRASEMTFGIGPAGTGKTLLAAYAAVEHLASGLVERVVLVRPAVEAGERLGFLPGGLKEKIDPYLRPIRDALAEILPAERVEDLVERGIVEAAPLAFLRGRTLKRSFVVLDEAQNATSGQMKMFLTRLGRGSKAVVNGDPTQIDLPNPAKSGLLEAEAVLGRVRGIAFCRFDEADAVRHPLVERIVRAYRSDGRAAPAPARSPLPDSEDPDAGGSAAGEDQPGDQFGEPRAGSD